METLRERRKRSDGVFMFKLMPNQIDVPFLASTIIPNQSNYVTRNRNTLSQAFHSTDYGFNEAMNRMTRLVNNRPDLFSDLTTLTNFKKNFRF